jgi:hypothetical protein
LNQIPNLVMVKRWNERRQDMNETLFTCVGCSESDSDNYDPCPDYVDDEDFERISAGPFYGRIASLRVSESEEDSIASLSDRLEEASLVADLTAEVDNALAEWIGEFDEENAVLIELDSMEDYRGSSDDSDSTATALNNVAGGSIPKCSPPSPYYEMDFHSVALMGDSNDDFASAEDRMEAGETQYSFVSDLVAGLGISISEFPGSRNIGSFSGDARTQTSIARSPDNAEPEEPSTIQFDGFQVSGRTAEQTSDDAIRDARGFRTTEPIRFTVQLSLEEIARLVNEQLQACSSAPVEAPLKTQLISEERRLALVCDDVLTIDRPDALGGACGVMADESGELDCPFLDAIVAPAIDVQGYTPSDGSFDRAMEFSLEAETYGASVLSFPER